MAAADAKSFTPSPDKLPFSSDDRQSVVEASRWLARAGLVTGTSGNISLRRDGHVLVTPSGVDYEELEPDQLATISMTGDILDHRLPPSSETPLHLAIYGNTSAAAVVHTHGPYATAVGLVVDELPAVHYAIRSLGGPVRVAPYATFGTDELAGHVSEALRDRRGAILRNHGAVAIGDSLVEAKSNAEKLEWLAALYFRAKQLGEPAVLTSAELADVARQALTRGYRP